MPSSASSSGAANVGRMPDRTSASIVLEWALRCTITSSPRWASARPAARLPCEAPLTRNHARRAPHASAARRLRLGEGRRLGAEVHAVGEGRDVERQRPRAEGLEQSLVGALAALVAGHVQARGVAPGVGEEGVEIGRLGLALLVSAQGVRLPRRPSPAAPRRGRGGARHTSAARALRPGARGRAARARAVAARRAARAGAASTP